MFRVLLASDAGVPRRTGWGVASTAAHLTVIAAAVAVTLKVPAPPPRIEQLLPVLPWRPPTPAGPSAPTIIANPLRPGPVLIEVPSAVPTVPIVQSNLGDVALSLAPIGTAAADLLGDVVHTPIHRGGVYPVDSVERQVTPRPNNPPPEYPSALRSAQVEGSVLVQFVVDTTGSVEHTSIAIMRASHEQFASAVRRWLARTRYMPAQIGGRPVRQLVQQEVAFTLDK